MKNADFIVNILRNVTHMSYRQMAAALGCSHNAVWLWSKGLAQPRGVFVVALKKLAAQYGVRI